MVPDPKWLDAVKLPLRVVVGIFLGSVALLALNNQNWVPLKDLGAAAHTVIATVAVLTGALTITGAIAILIEACTAKRKRNIFAERQLLKDQRKLQQRLEAEATIIARIEYLSESEIRHLAAALRDKSQSFYTWVHSPAVTTLMEKGLVRTLGGTHHENRYPFTIVDFVWKHLLEIREEILAKDDANRKAEEEKKRRGR